MIHKFKIINISVKLQTYSIRQYTLQQYENDHNNFDITTQSMCILQSTDVQHLLAYKYNYNI